MKLINGINMYPTIQIKISGVINDTFSSLHSVAKQSIPVTLPTNHVLHQFFSLAPQ